MELTPCEMMILIFDEIVQGTKKELDWIESLTGRFSLKYGERDTLTKGALKCREILKDNLKNENLSLSRWQKLLPASSTT